MNPVTREQRDEAIAHFKYEGTLVKDCPYGSGHINDTFLLIFEIAEMGRIKVILPVSYTHLTLPTKLEV